MAKEPATLNLNGDFAIFKQGLQLLLVGFVSGPRGLPMHGGSECDDRQYVSLINRATIATLEAAISAPVDPIQFRANIYFDGAPA